jgi:hypothetical protein
MAERKYPNHRDINNWNQQNQCPPTVKASFEDNFKTKPQAKHHINWQQ